MSGPQPLQCSLHLVEAVTRLACHLDLSMLHFRSTKIADEAVLDADLPYCDDLAQQLGGRLLIKYARQETVERLSVLSGGSHFPGRHFVTPTPVAARDLVSALALPPLRKPRWALLLMPSLLSSVRGPRRIAGGIGIEYFLEDGFPVDAIVAPGWALEHR